MEESEHSRVQELIDEMDKQHKRLLELTAHQNNVRSNLVLFKFVKIFKERTDIHHVEVTITQNLEEAEMLSGEKVNIQNGNSGTFLVIGIMLPTTLHTSLVENTFNMNLSIHFNNKRLCRQVSVNKEHTFTVIPWKEFPINSELDISIFGKVHDRKIIFNIPTIVLNISYFIRSLEYTKSQPKCGNYKKNLLEISRLYCAHKKCFYNPYEIIHTMIVPDEVELLNVLLKDFPQHLKKFQKTDEYKFEVLRNTSMSSQANLKKTQNCLEMQSDVGNLYELKKYFIDQMYYNEIKERRSLKKFLEDIHYESYKEYSVAYHSLRKLWQMV